MSQLIYMPLKWVLLVIYSIFCAIYETDSSTFHVSLLGRNVSNLPTGTVGMFFVKTSGVLPVASSNVSGCLYNISDMGLGTGSYSFTFDTPDCQQLIPSGNEHVIKGIKIESEDEFTLHVIQSESSGEPGDGYLAIPDENLGNEYYVTTYCATGGTCQFAVTGIIDSTTVDIIFPNNTKTSVVCVDGIPSPSTPSTGSAVPFTLNEFDVLHFESEQDLSGTYVYASNKIAVFVGARGIPNKNGSFSEIAEQIPPMNKWGSQFVVIPNYLNDAGDIVKIVTKTDNTVIHILGFSPFNIENAGDAVETRIDWQMHSTIHSSNPVLVVQIMNVNLYNASNTIGSATMVLVPHTEQWVATEIFFHCVVSSLRNETLIAVVSSHNPSDTVSVWPMPAAYYSPLNVINGSRFDAMVFKPADIETKVNGTLTSAYGYCEGKYAMLLGADWGWTNEECVVTTSSPGDDVDNDCDGQFDEDDCTEADLETSFTSVQNSSGQVSYKTFNVRGAGYVNLTITSCDIVMLTLKSNFDKMASITIWISTSLLVEQICISKCYPAFTGQLTVTDCTLGQKYSIEWFEDDVGLKHVFHAAYSNYSFDEDDVFGINYDELILSAFVGSADFLVGLPVKDCNKIISASADTAGVTFVLPVEDTDKDFVILLYTKSDLVSAIQIELNVENVLGVLTVNAGQTFSIWKTDITEAFYSRITLTAVNGELSVYLQRSVAGTATGLSILPIDILGPSYHLFTDSAIDQSNSSAKVCDIFATERTAVLDSQFLRVTDHTEMTIGDLNDLGRGLVVADRPLSVFCGTFTGRLVQMPPRETLGRQFYIPKLDLDLIDASAEINIVMTEDSTVLTIRGDYDQMDPVDFTGDVYIRTVRTDTVYSILASKPVQVHLEVSSSTGSWGSVVVIPPVQQYKSEHLFPGLNPLHFVFNFSSAVHLNGTEVPSQVTQAALVENNATSLVYAEGPVFTLTVVSNVTANPGTTFFIASDVQYGDINELCTLTTGSPGDGIDNDCDGLIDEESCSESKVPGTMDYDLDGALNEDCSVTTSATTQTANLSIPLEIVTCRPNNSNETTSDSDQIVINSQDGFSANLSSIVVPNIPTYGSEPSYEPLTQTGGSVAIPTTTPPPGSTALMSHTGKFACMRAPVETCVVDCLCPCGWVNPPRNYTEEELEVIIEEIQEKLRVSKAELSATIRSKTSATDDRPSAAAVGYVGLVFIIVTITTVALLDITTLFRDARIIMENVRQVFQP